MNANDTNRTIALAGIFQATRLVSNLAYDGSAEKTQAEPMIKSLFLNDVQNVEDIYGGLDHLQTGFRTLVEMLSNPGKEPRSVETTRYAIGLLHLERQLNSHRDMSQKLITEIDEVGRQCDYFGGCMNATVISRLAEIYKDTISELGPKIVVKGEQDHLSNPEIAAQIRALLLAGIRSAVLWRQAGGSRLRLFFNRKKMIDEAKRLAQVNVVNFPSRD